MGGWTTAQQRFVPQVTFGLAVTIHRYTGRLDEVTALAAAQARGK